MKHKIIQMLPTRLYLELRWWDYKLNRSKSFKNTQRHRVTHSNEYGSYEPFDKNKAIFVHIPKCAGISLNKTLFNSVGGGHTTLDQYIHVFEPKNFQEYFKFTVVRNPWDRVVSAYTFLQKGGINKWDKKFFDNTLSQFESFEDFVLNWLTPANIKTHLHFKEQHGFFIDKYRKTSVDYIGYLENIAEDFDYIANRIGCKQTLNIENAVKRADYKDFYNEKTRAHVGNIYKTDIELLNYDFDGPKKLVRKIAL